MDSVLYYRVALFPLTPFLIFFISTRLSIFTLVLLLLFFVLLDLHFFFFHFVV